MSTTKNLSGVPALLQWTTRLWLVARDSVGKHSAVASTVTKIDGTRTADLVRGVIGGDVYSIDCAKT